MGTSLLHLGAIVGGVVGAVALAGWVARLVFGSARLPVWLRRRREPVAPAGRPLEQVAADLRRLGAQLARVPAGAPMARRRGLQAAYDDVLVEAARLLEVPHALDTVPPGRPRDVERLRLRTALAEVGLAVPD
ncbi:hypothetical protein [Geodermatophilus chilensis]|jgi:hypothetical protein|uniref:hypothetical protein n=1 Tax=Geodermatophilus chilensis TaxID=2035835 RepID=UPI001E3DF216|nr:hypothetical protein [Geodermatophilus chilensis]